MLGELRFENRGRLEPRRVRLVGRGLRRRVIERVQHGDAAQELLLHRRAARVRKVDLAELIALLGEGNAHGGQRKGDQRRCDVDTRFHLYHSYSKFPTAVILTAQRPLSESGAAVVDRPPLTPGSSPAGSRAST